MKIEDILEEMESLEADGVDFFDSHFDVKENNAKSYTKDELEKLQPSPGYLRRYWKNVDGQKVCIW